MTKNEGIAIVAAFVTDFDPKWTREDSCGPQWTDEGHDLMIEIIEHVEKKVGETIVAYKTHADGFEPGHTGFYWSADGRCEGGCCER